MKILLLNRVAAPLEGGMNRHVLDVATRLKEAGETVALVHGRNPPSQFRGTGYLLNDLDRNTASAEIVFERMEAVLEDFRPDIVQLHGVDNTSLYGWLAARVPTVKFVHTHRQYCSGENMTWSLPRRICSRKHGPACLLLHACAGCGSSNVFRNAANYRRVGRDLAALRLLHGVQVASPVMRENLVRNGIAPEKIALIPLYAPEPAVTRRPLAVGRRMVLHVGGLMEKKGVWVMLDAIDELPQDVELVFAGGGELEQELCAKIRSRGLGERVRVMGELDPSQTSALLHQATLVVMPLRWNEPLGLFGMNAMAHGKPVVSFRCEGIAGWLEDGVTGALVQFNRRGAFVAKVNELLDDPEQLQEMGRNGLARWKERFRPEHHVDQLRKYYREVVGKAALSGA